MQGYRYYKKKIAVDAAAVPTLVQKSWLDLLEVADWDIKLAEGKLQVEG